MRDRRETPQLLFPLLLIAAGALLMAHQLGLISISLGEYLGLWPLLLILFGLEALLRALRAPALVAASAALVLTLLAGLMLQPVLLPDRTPGQATYNYAKQNATVGELSLHSNVANTEIDTNGAQDMFVVEIDEPLGLENIEIIENRDKDSLSVAFDSQRQDASFLLGPGTTPANWQAHIDPTTPIMLDASTGVGTTRLDLETAHLSGLNADTGVGNIEASLPNGEYNAYFSTGIGRITIELGEDTAARIQVSEGLSTTTASSKYSHIDGYYVTPSYNEDLPFVSITVDTGIGSVKLH